MSVVYIPNMDIREIPRGTTISFLRKEDLDVYMGRREAIRLEFAPGFVFTAYSPKRNK